MARKFTVSLAVIVGLAFFSCERNDQHGALFLTSSSDMICKAGGPLKASDPPPENSCIEYNYVGDSVLTLMHLNAAFNCCPESFAVDIEVKGDSLIIREEDAKQLCKCNCIYDLIITLHHLPADKYHVRIAEPYVNGNLPRLIFDLDLKKTKSGEFCVTRPTGWWM